MIPVHRGKAPVRRVDNPALPSSAANPIAATRYGPADAVATALLTTGSAALRFFPDWVFFADITVANLRTEAGRNPRDKQLHELVGELSTCSPEFRTRWSAHDVRIHSAGTKHFRHSVVGDLVLAYETVDLRNGEGMSMTVYAAEPGSPSENGLKLLASWAADPVTAGDRAELATDANPEAR